MSEKLKLRDILILFLKGGNIFYPVVETRIIQMNPLQITDDGVRYLDISNLQDEVLSKIKDSHENTQKYKLILSDWNFIFKKVPNSHEFYFDIASTNFKVAKDSEAPEIDTDPTKMVDDDEVRWNFEIRKRKELEEIIKMNQRVKNSPGKPGHKGGSQSQGPGTARETVSPKEGSTPQKTTPSKSNSGEKKSGTKVLVCPEILSIEELLDLPIPIFTKESIQKAYYGSELPARYYYGERFSYDSQGGAYRSQERDLFEEDTLGKRVSNRVQFDDLLKALTKKLVSWSQLVFTKKTVDHLKQRPFLIEDR